MQSKATTTPPAASSLAKLAARLAAAERAYDQSPTRRHLSKVTIAYQNWYFATHVETAR
jgi:hypothetical protein